MDQQKPVEKLEGELKEVNAEVIVKMGLKRMSLLSSDYTASMMASAAAAVY